LACYDVATVLGTPFISGKDSLNNEFRPLGAKEPISIPPSLLISALGQIDDVRHCVSMDLKEPGDLLFLVGLTLDELGGSHFALVNGLSGGKVPKMDSQVAKKTFAALHRAIHSGLVRACHDLSEGGLAVAAAEMAFAGGLGADISLFGVPNSIEIDEAASVALAKLRKSMSPTMFHPLATWAPATAALLFSESNTRFLCEVTVDDAQQFHSLFVDIPHAVIGQVSNDGRLEILGIPRPSTVEPGEWSVSAVIGADITALKAAWQKPLRW